MALGTFGRLVLCDYVGLPLNGLEYIAEDFTKREALSLDIMPEVRSLFQL